mgnify:CR=1 FL=1
MIETVLAALIDGLALAMLIFLIASGLTMIFGLMGILNFAHGAFFMLGAYVVISMVFDLGLSYAFSLPLSFLTGFAIGLVVEILTLRPLHGKHIAQLIVTLGLLYVFTQLVVVLWGTMPTLYIPPFLAGGRRIGDLVVLNTRIFIIITGLLVALCLHLFLSKTKVGLIVLAGVEDAQMVEALGINIKKVFTMTFALGTGLAFLGGSLAEPWQGANLALSGYMFLGFVAVVIGGLGNYKGSFYASLLVGIIHALTAHFLPVLTFVIDFLIMALVLLIRPRGLFG